MAWVPELPGIGTPVFYPDEILPSILSGYNRPTSHAAAAAMAPCCGPAAHATLEPPGNEDTRSRSSSGVHAFPPRLSAQTIGCVLARAKGHCSARRTHRRSRARATRQRSPCATRWTISRERKWVTSGERRNRDQSGVRDARREELGHGEWAHRVRIAPQEKGPRPDLAQAVGEVGPIFQEPAGHVRQRGPILGTPVNSTQAGYVHASRGRDQHETGNALRVLQREAHGLVAFFGLSKVAAPAG